ncbi:potassium-transporting ATPase subunit KdpC [Streptomyces sp. NBC_01304]|uniref:potassium-transporting ATPase subunit KdpC n=1 Tax=Streptomyces sp. NBC_01304 TaxID=2903818 RepID=UPI002E0E8689|nr:potassium-transporting ATPase subunit KdpC [Streptomyces sp. NBC_01304]
MNTSLHSTGRLLWAALRALLVLTVVTGVVYPLLITAFAQAAFHDKANGSKIKAGGRVVGSELIGQSFHLKGTDRPDPRFFQPRPSNGDYDPLATGSSQLGASSPKLVKKVEAAKKEVAAFNDVPESRVPKDAVTGSASGIDPHISRAYAHLQAARVARANGLGEGQVRKLVARHTGGRTAGYMGEPHVNVLTLNVAVRELAAK